MQHYAVAIVGGGPSGLSTALFLAHAAPALAERIIVLEKEAYPREKICGGAVGARADKLLASIGVRVEVPSVVVRELSLRTFYGSASGRVTELGRVVRRIEFDHALARIARERGVRVQEHAAVSGIDVAADGVTIDTACGPVHADAVIGADGVGGYVRRWLGLSAGRFRAQVIELDTEPVAADRARDSLHFDFFDSAFTGYAWDFPTLVDGRELVCRGIYHLRLNDQDDKDDKKLDRIDIAALLAQRLAGLGLDMARYRVKRFAERGFESNQRLSRARVALVGEAAGIDGFSGEGIPQAIEYGAFAGRYLAEKWAARDWSFRDWDKRLAKTTPGSDLHWREAMMLRYYGAHRDTIDRYFTALPEFVQCSAEQMAGLPLSNMSFYRAAAGASLRALRQKLLGRVDHQAR